MRNTSSMLCLHEILHVSKFSVTDYSLFGWATGKILALFQSPYPIWNSYEVVVHLRTYSRCVHDERTAKLNNAMYASRMRRRRH